MLGMVYYLPMIKAILIPCTRFDEKSIATNAENRCSGFDHDKNIEVLGKMKSGETDSLYVAQIV